MSNIIGEGFASEIIDQINVRQKIYGSVNRTNEQLNYLNNNSGWCRLVSSVNVVESPPNRNLPNRGVDLAKNFILFNGTSKLDNIKRGGVWPGTGDSNDYAYGIGGTNFGLRPMPGITQATIKTETRGSLKTATISIKANNREQFDIIDILYLRLGFTMLLEWGVTSYFDNNEAYISDNPHSLVNEFLTGKDFNYGNYPEKINEERLKSKGNYDAIIGKVVNFNWTFTKEGTYDITIVLRSMGDVIESLKTNILLPSTIGVGPGVLASSANPTPPTLNLNIPGSPPTPQIQTPFKPPSPQPQDVIKSFSNIHEIGKEFYRLQQILQNNDTVIEDNNVEAFTQKFINHENIYYIRFGYLLKFIEQRIIPKVNDENPLVKIDTSIDSNIIYLLARQISTDPGICVCNRTIKNTNGNFITFFSKGNKFDVSKNSSSYGKIMNLYFNMEWVLTTIDSLKDENGKISLYDLINNLCKGWNQASGNFSKIQPVITEDKILQIIDELALPDKNDWLKSSEYSAIPVSTQDAIFKVYTKDSFVKDINFNTTLSNNLATMITIGATSKGYVVGQDSTALSRMNAGLIDRFKEKINNSGDPGREDQSAQALPNNFKEIYKTFNIFLSQLGGDNPIWNQEAINNFTNTANNFYEYDQAYQVISPNLPSANPKFSANPTSQIAQQTGLAQTISNNLVNSPALEIVKLSTKRSSPTIGFLPFDLQLTINGLSGIKIYQKYTIDNNFLPSNYPDSLDFIIKGITHTIQNNEWTTIIESITLPKNPGGTVIGEGAVETASSRDNNRGTISTGNLNAIRANSSLRQVILNAGYNENSPEYRFALAIGTKEGWNATADGGIGSRSYKNNNPGNLDFSGNLKSIDSNVVLENNPYGENRFAHFTTAELGVKALIELKIKRWGLGNMPITEGNQNLIVNKKGGKKYIKNTPPTLAQFVYTFAPPNENNTEKYIQDLILSLGKIQPKITRDTLVKNILA